MSYNNQKIHIGFFPDFVNPTLLFAGEKDSFARMSDFFRSLKSEGQGVKLEDPSLFVPKNVEVILKVESTARGMKKLNDHSFEWVLDEGKLADFGEMLHALAEDNIAAHQYLECGSNDDVQVMASIGEYGANVFDEEK